MAATRPLVSVVIPCLNRAQYLAATIDSVLAQDYDNLECIVIDGGSSDGTVEILESYGDKISWVSEPDKGHADAINKGWQSSRGEILAWLNADDVWVVPNSVSTAVGLMTEHPVIDVAYGDCEAIDARGNKVGWSYFREWDLAHAIEYCDHCISQPAAFLRRSAVERVGWLDANIVSGKDHDLWLRISLHGQLKHFPVTLARERVTPGTWSTRGDITAAGKVALTKKFFSLPEVPESIRRKKRRSVSNAYLKAAEYAWSGGRHWGAWTKYILAAILYDPRNLQRAGAGIRGPLATIAVERWRRVRKAS